MAQIVPFDRSHCGHIIDHLRPEDREELLATRGDQSLRVLPDQIRILNGPAWIVRKRIAMPPAQKKPQKFTSAASA